MEITKYKCDICGFTQDGDSYDKPNGWVCIYVQTEDAKDFWQSTKDICGHCDAIAGLSVVMGKLLDIHTKKHLYPEIL